MRRKSTRNAGKSTPDKPKPEPKKTRRQSSRRRKRSSSKSSENSEDEIPLTEIKNCAQENVEIEQSSFKDGNTAENDGKNDNAKLEQGMSDTKEENTKSPERKTSRRGRTRGSSLSKTANIEDSAEENKTKGKSKDKNKSKTEQTSSYVEPETQNDNVQGTPQSPSNNDNADKEKVVQNINDASSSFVDEASNSRDSCGNKEIENSNINVTQSESENNQRKETELNENKLKGEPNHTNNSNCSKEKTIQPTEEQVEFEQSKKIEQSKPEENPLQKSGIAERKDTDSLSTKENKTEVVDTTSKDNVVVKKKIKLRRSTLVFDRIDTAKETSATIDNSEKVDNKLTKNETIVKDVASSKSSEEKLTQKKEEKPVEVEVEKPEVSIIKPVVKDPLMINRKRTISQRTDSVTEDKSLDIEEKPKKVLKKIKLNRTIAPITDSENENEEKRKPLQEKKKRWGSSVLVSNISAAHYKIDVDSLKALCPSLQFLQESEVKLRPEPPAREHKKSESESIKRKQSTDEKSDDSDRREFGVKASADASADNNENIIAMNRKISIVDDTASKLKPPPSPAKNPTAEVLFISNLVRPFTVKQLKELLLRTGNIVDEGFWTDRIKSKCYVRYESAEEAEATRNALHGVNWPIGNGKKLVIDYATVEDLEKAKNPPPVIVKQTKAIAEKENEEPKKPLDSHKEHEREDAKKRRDGPVREWDLGKEEVQGRRSRSRSRERARKHSRRSLSPNDYTSKKRRKVEEAVPQKLMDDLFLKTKATPSIYWQPLTPEEIALKQQQRLVRMEEHKRRMEETRNRLKEARRGQFRRR